MISTIVFDLDGTLVDSNAIKRQGFFDLVEGHVSGCARMAAVLDRVQGDRRAVFAAYLEDAAGSGLAPAQDLATLVSGYSDRVDACVASAPEMPGAVALLQELRRFELRLYVSSATPVASLRRILDQRNWLQYFADSFGHPASKRDTIRRIRDMNRAGVESLAVIGDGADDRDSAASIGCAFYPVGEARGAGAGERVFTLAELPDILLD